ncbi:MAG TPA: FAD-dependent oxidoreductase [Thermoanaerobaculia bacterium]|nr:FAD-dependent oxidoreductase [Thermoanaerobaculia bacterium]
MPSEPRTVASPEAIARLEDIVGKAHVSTGEEEIDRRSRCIIPWRRRCAAVVYPGSVEEIRQIVLAAAQLKLPLWTFSKGKNWGYGATMANRDGAIVLILERLNRILEVNEELAYAVVEPGVTYRQLHDHLRGTGSKLWSDSSDGPPEGSVLGNALDKGVGETPYGDHFGTLCGLEVVLPNGDVLRTGGGPPQCHTWNTHKWGTGPVLDGLFAQSNYGIVTKAGVWLMPAPQHFNSFSFELREEKDLPALIDVMRRLALGGVFSCAHHLINDVCVLTIVTQNPHAADGGGTRLSPQMVAQLRRRYRISPWAIAGALYGSKKRVRADQAEIRRVLGPLGRVQFFSDGKAATVARLHPRLKRAVARGGLPRAAANFVTGTLFHTSLELMEWVPYVHSLLQGAPTEYFVRHAYFKSSRPRPDHDVDPVRDGCGNIWFAPMVPLSGAHVTRVLEMCRPLFEQFGFDFYVAMLMHNPRSIIALMSIFYQPENAEETKKASELYEKLCHVTLDAGYQQYRTSVAYMDRIFARTPELRRALDGIKGAVDKDNILAPGRYGIGLS